MLGNPVSSGILHYIENDILDKLWQKMREKVVGFRRIVLFEKSIKRPVEETERWQTRTGATHRA